MIFNNEIRALVAEIQIDETISRFCQPSNHFVGLSLEISINQRDHRMVESFDT